MGRFDDDELAELRADMADLVLHDRCYIEYAPHTVGEETQYTDSAELHCDLVADKNSPAQVDADGRLVPQLWNIRFADLATVLVATSDHLPRSGDCIRMKTSGRRFTITSYTNRESDDVLTLAKCQETPE